MKKIVSLLMTLALGFGLVTQGVHCTENAPKPRRIEAEKNTRWTLSGLLHTTWRASASIGAGYFAGRAITGYAYRAPQNRKFDDSTKTQLGLSAALCAALGIDYLWQKYQAKKVRDEAPLRKEYADRLPGDTSISQSLPYHEIQMRLAWLKAHTDEAPLRKEYAESLTGDTSISQSLPYHEIQMRLAWLKAHTEDLKKYQLISQKPIDSWNTLTHVKSENSLSVIIFDRKPIKVMHKEYVESLGIYNDNIRAAIQAKADCYNSKDRTCAEILKNICDLIQKSALPADHRLYKVYKSRIQDLIHTTDVDTAQFLLDHATKILSVPNPMENVACYEHNLAACKRHDAYNLAQKALRRASQQKEKNKKIEEEHRARLRSELELLQSGKSKLTFERPQDDFGACNNSIEITTEEAPQRFDPYTYKFLKIQQINSTAKKDDK